VSHYANIRKNINIIHEVLRCFINFGSNLMNRVNVYTAKDH
jgi:hypothetical protein